MIKLPCDICGEPSHAHHPNVEKNLCQTCANGDRLYGDKPALSPKPHTLGLYFVRLSDWRGVYSDPGSLKSFRIGYRYELGDWEIVRFDGSNHIDFIGSDETQAWEGRSSYVAVLGPQVFPPES